MSLILIGHPILPGNKKLRTNPGRLIGAQGTSCLAKIREVYCFLFTLGMSFIELSFQLGLIGQLPWRTMGHWWQQNKGISEQLLCQRCCQPEPREPPRSWLPSQRYQPSNKGCTVTGGAARETVFLTCQCLRTQTFFLTTKGVENLEGKLSAEEAYAEETGWREQLRFAAFETFPLDSDLFDPSESSISTPGQKQEETPEWECQRAAFGVSSPWKTSKQETQLAEPFLATAPAQWVDSFRQKGSDQQQSEVDARRKGKTPMPLAWLFRAQETVLTRHGRLPSLQRHSYSRPKLSQQTETKPEVRRHSLWAPIPTLDEPLGSPSLCSHTTQLPAVKGIAPHFNTPFVLLPAYFRDTWRQLWRKALMCAGPLLAQEFQGPGLDLIHNLADDT